MDKDKDKEESLIKAVKESGFPFENHVCMSLKRHGWLIIPNRYYIDDIKGVEREVDILAYKYTYDENENICYYTALIISCKKSEKYKWVFLTRKQDENDININYFPFHFFTDDNRLKYMTDSHLSDLEREYKRNIKVKDIFDFPKSIVSYQVCEKDKFTKNEPIHDSLITLIKALDYEKKSLKKRTAKASYRSYYSFNLLSLFYGDMNECIFNDDESVKCSDVSNINYLNRHIVNNVESFYSVLFATNDVLDSVIDRYDALVECNKKLFPQMISDFYNDIFSSPDKVDLIWDEFVSATSWKMSYLLTEELDSQIDAKFSQYEYIDSRLKLDVEENGRYDNNDIYRVLNNPNSKASKFVKENLESFFRYKGPLTFGLILPF